MDVTKEEVDKNNLPEHVAIIMDGNGRWAKGKGAKRLFGHKNAIAAVRDVTEGCAELGIGYLTLYAFSTENWARPKMEVDGLMRLLVSTIKKETETLLKNNVKLACIGSIDNLPKSCQRELQEAIQATSHNTGLTLVLALSYSGRWEIVDAVKKIACDIAENNIEIEDINTSLFERYLNTKDIPDPALLIRTSGEMRISNFLLWQLAYTELYMTEVLWPDFRKSHLYAALADYQRRERRFGKISEQMKS